MVPGKAWLAGPAALWGSTHFGVVGLLQLLLVQPHLGVVLLSHLVQGLSQLVLILDLTPGVHFYQARLMLPPGLINLLGRKKRHAAVLLSTATPAQAK